jgi:NAD+ synthase
MIVDNRIDFITNWIRDYANQSSSKPFNLVIGVSGGIDSAVTSTLCAKTNLKTIVISMPIKQNKNQHSLSLDHIEWLKSNFDNVESHIVSLDGVFSTFQNIMVKFKSELAFANSRSRLRMLTLYQIAQSNNALVVGTGNKVEDFGIGFYTKYGDGGVDISPIADCTKTQVWEMGKFLGIPKKIIEAKPTDGLWDDSRNDEDQIGLSYEQLEEAMINDKSIHFEKYNQLRKPNLHKMEPIPICKFNKK